MTRAKQAYTQQIEELKRHIEEEVKVTVYEISRIITEEKAIGRLISDTNQVLIWFTGQERPGSRCSVSSS